MSPTLPVLPLAHPLILLPTGRITLPVSRLIGEALFALVQDSDDQPVVAAVPFSSPDSSLYPWGTASRIVRLIKPPARNPKQPYLLSLNGITRVRIVDNLASDISSGIVHLRVEYPKTDGIPSPENVIKFKGAALKLLNQLARDTTQEVKRESLNKVAALVEEVSQMRAAWISDVILSSTNAEYKDKLGT
jgi:ATP-dependent Lon protease